tara:strand:+ start:263 stop:1186 length:924 start_codon:yes stop_codon:yes gene_type:complete
MSSFNFMQKALQEILCCLICKGDLKIVTENELKCYACYQKYPIKEGILIFMLDDLLKEQAEEQKAREEAAKKHGFMDSDKILKSVSLHHSLQIMNKKAKECRASFDATEWVLDVGCGTGCYWQSTKGGNIILLDFTFENLRAAKLLLKDENHVLFIQANAGRLPIKTKSVSGIWSVQVTQHFSVSIMKLFLKETKRILKDNFLIEIYNLNSPWFHKVIYKLLGKKYHIKGKNGEITLNRMNGRELSSLWSTVFNKASFEIGYSEFLFHPDLRFKLKGEYTSFFDRVLSKLSGTGKIFARQIHIKISH